MAYRLPAAVPATVRDMDAATAAAVAALPPGNALLVVLHGPAAGSRFLLDTDLVTLGRDPNGDIFLDDITVSRRHAEIMRAGTAFTVRDVGSLNGTYLDRVRVDAAALVDRAELQIGKYRMVFCAGPTGA